VSIPEPQVRSFTIGRFKAHAIQAGGQKLDGGAMFGVVPRTLWERKTVPDDRHRIQLAMRPLLVEAQWGRMLIDCGAGDKMGAKELDIYALDRSHTLDDALAAVRLSSESIEIALATHLHWDHFGGATERVDQFRPNAPRRGGRGATPARRRATLRRRSSPSRPRTRRAASRRAGRQGR